MRTWLAVLGVTACGLLLATGIVVAVIPQLGLRAVRSSPVAEPLTVTPTYDTSPQKITVSAAPSAVTALGASSHSAVSFTDGRYLVGKDIEAGTYRSEGGPACYWARYADADSSPDSLLDSHIADGPTRVTVHEGQLVESNHCAPFDRVG